MDDPEVSLRRQLRAAAAGLIPDTHLDEVVDLAIHAVDKAFEAVGQVVTRASIAPAKMAATSIALSIIAQRAAARLEDLQGVAAALGMSLTTKTVSVGGQANG
jgi:hypothetical protein